MVNKDKVQIHWYSVWWNIKSWYSDKMSSNASVNVIIRMNGLLSGLCLGIKHNGSVWPGTHSITHYEAKESDGVRCCRASDQCRNHAFYGMDSHTNWSVMWWSDSAKNVALWSVVQIFIWIYIFSQWMRNIGCFGNM